MNMQQIQHPTLPLVIGFNLNSQIAIVPTVKFKTIIDGKFMFDNDGYSVDGVEHSYGAWYDYDGSLKEWIEAQKLGE